MENVSQIEQSLKQILEERANVLARETGCIERQRKFSGADLVQTLVFGWLSHPDASLEMLASTAAIREVYVSDTAVHNRFNESCARFLHAVLEEMVSVLVHAEQPVPLELLHRFSSVVLEDSSSITLPKELADCWQGSGGGLGGGEAAIKLHVRWDLTHGHLFGPRLTDGRVSDQCSPFRQMSLSAGSLYIADLGYFESLCSHGTPKSWQLHPHASQKQHRVLHRARQTLALAECFTPTRGANQRDACTRWQ